MNQSTIPSGTSSGTGALTRASLLDAARRVFARNGFDGASVRKITAEAEVNLGAVTYHFGSKRGLYDAVLTEELAPLLDRVSNAVHGDGTALERMVAVTEAYFEHLAEHPDLPHLILQEVTAGREPPKPVQRMIGAVRGMLLTLHAEGQADGTIRPGHPGFASLSVIAQPIYLTLIAPALRSIAHIDLDDDAVRGEATRHMKDFVRRGLTAHLEEAP